MNFPDIGQRPIALAAVSTSYFERTQIYHGQAQIRLGPELLDHLHRHGGLTFEAIRYTTTVRNYTIENAVLDGDTLLLIQDGLAIPETAYFVPAHKKNRPVIDNDALIRLTRDEDVIVGYNNAHYGYQNWLTQSIPAVDWSLRHQRSRPVRLLMPDLEPWQEDFIRILGHDSVPRLKPQSGKQYFLPRVEYSEFLNGSTSFSVCLSTLNTAQRILNALPSFPSVHKAIYVPCANPYYGSIANEADVLALLELRGIHVIDQKLLDTVTRINLFRHADLVIGPHGQGLTDILFCKPGTVLWEWMPEHLQNASFNRLAQAAKVDYRGDLFKSVADVGQPGRWVVDVARVANGLSELLDVPSRYVARPVLGIAATTALPKAGSDNASAVGKPIDELLLEFESLGDTCEFGLVQRHAGVEPLGLLRFAGMAVPEEERVSKLVSALIRQFEGLGSVGTITVYLPGEHGEFMARESVYDLQYHTGMFDTDITPDELQAREVKRLGFLRRKLLEDLRAGEKIWIWQSVSTTRLDQVRPLLNALRAIGPNTLLWVVECDNEHPPGTAERLDQDFIKGYVEHFTSYVHALDLSTFSWIEMCQSAHNLCRPAEVPARCPEAVHVPLPRTLSAMEFLTQNRPKLSADNRPVSISSSSQIGRFLSTTFSRLLRKI